MLGMILAVLLKEVKGASFIKSAIFLGMVTPMIIGGVMIRFLFDEHAGVINALLRLIGLGKFEKSWTAYPDTALLSLILGSIWLWTGFSMTLYSAGLATIPKELYEAADVDGANAIQKFIHITIPSLRPVTVTVVAMTMLWELKIFDIVYTATLGGPGGSSMVMALQMYFLAFRRLKPNLASVIATFLTALTLIIGVWFVRSVRRGGR
jgi:multiple sugar transport system permease protein